MTVYVDDTRRPFGSMLLCRMLASDPAELQAMAVRIDSADRWHRSNYYLVPRGKRALAAKFGAIEITSREASQMLRALYSGKPMPTLEEARAQIEEFRLALSQKAEDVES